MARHPQGAAPASWARVEAYTPYPIHGIDEALGLRSSPLGGMVLVMGILGAITALGFQVWISAVDYPIITGGKAPCSWEAFVPIMFEVTVLFATFTAGLGMLFLLNKLPFFGHPVLASKAIKGITRDRFALALEAESEAFDSADAARRPRRQPAPSRSRSCPRRTAAPSSPATTSCARSAASSPPAWWRAWRCTGPSSWFPVLPPMVHMQDQPRLNAQKASAFFKDGHGMQHAGAGHRGPGLPAHGHRHPGGGRRPGEPPAPHQGGPRARAGRSTPTAARSATAPLGNGVGSLTAAYGAKPANLQAPAVPRLPGRQDLPGHREREERHALLRGRPDRGPSAGRWSTTCAPSSAPRTPRTRI